MEFSDATAVPAPTRFSLAGGFAIAVALASMMHAPATPFAQNGPLGLFGFDKWVHVGSYALVAFFLAYALVARTTATLVAIAVVTVVLGIGVELIQSTIPWRSMETVDVAANTAGTVGALGLWKVSWRALPIDVGDDTER